ncbi:MAG: ABC transporter ATP-binding protein [Bdellovibrionales bacterium]|nr:ABC transporter ATP-binding protein [Bdellovibrionales bacterium]
MSLVENLFHNYGDFKLNILRWEISDQGVTALWGPSGSGKTSVFRNLIGLDSCKTLRWTLKGQDLAQLPVAKRKLGVVFQSLELFPHLTAEENIQFAGQARKLKSEVILEKLKVLSQQLQIESLLKRRVGLLSGGERQRVAIARALIGEPQFLFLDEPFSSLDQGLRGEARFMIKNVIQRHQIPTLLITHDEADLSILADHVVRIEKGELIK